MAAPGSSPASQDLRSGGGTGSSMVEGACGDADGCPLRSACLAGVILGPLSDFGVGSEPYAGFGLCHPDQFLDDPDARTIADHVRVHRQLKDAALVIGRLEFAAEDVEHVGGRRIWPQRRKAV